MRVLRSGDLGQHAGPRGGPFSPGVETRRRSLALDGRRQGVPAARGHRRHDRRQRARAREIPGRAMDAPARGRGADCSRWRSSTMRRAADPKRTMRSATSPQSMEKSLPIRLHRHTGCAARRALHSSGWSGRSISGMPGSSGRRSTLCCVRRTPIRGGICSCARRVSPTEPRVRTCASCFGALARAAPAEPPAGKVCRVTGWDLCSPPRPGPSSSPSQLSPRRG